MRELVKVFKALANENRLRVLKMLEGRQMCVCEIKEVLGVSQPSVSRHLKELRDASLVEEISGGIWANYQLPGTLQNEYAGLIIKHLKKWINQDERIVQDRRKARRVNRKEICEVR